MKRFLSHYLYIPQMGFVKECVVEVNNNGVVSSFTLFEGERAGIVWVQGVLTLACGKDNYTGHQLEMDLLSAKGQPVYSVHLTPLLNDIPESLKGDVTPLNYTLTLFAF